MGYLLDDLNSRPLCDLICGPLDGRQFPIEDDRDTLTFRDVDRLIIDTYVRVLDTTTFRYTGRQSDAAKEAT